MQKLNRIQLVEMAVGLYFTLEARANCPDCGGSGGRWMAVGIDGDDVDYEICQCQIDAEKVLEGLKAPHDALLDEYLRNKGYHPDQIAKAMREVARAALGKLAAELFGENPEGADDGEM